MVLWKGTQKNKEGSLHIGRRLSLWLLNSNEVGEFGSWWHIHTLPLISFQPLSLSHTHTQRNTIKLFLCHKFFHFRIVNRYLLKLMFLHFLLFYVWDTTVLESYFIIMCCHAELIPGGKFPNFKDACSLLKNAPLSTFFRRLSKMILFNQMMPMYI